MASSYEKVDQLDRLENDYQQDEHLTNGKVASGEEDKQEDDEEEEIENIKLLQEDFR